MATLKATTLHKNDTNETISKITLNRPFGNEPRWVIKSNFDALRISTIPYVKEGKTTSYDLLTIYTDDSVSFPEGIKFVGEKRTLTINSSGTVLTFNGMNYVGGNKKNVFFGPTEFSDMQFHTKVNLTANTPKPRDNSNKIATTEFVQNAVSQNKKLFFLDYPVPLISIYIPLLVDVYNDSNPWYHWINMEELYGMSEGEYPLVTFPSAGNYEKNTASTGTLIHQYQIDNYGSWKEFDINDYTSKGIPSNASGIIIEAEYISPFAGNYIPAPSYFLSPESIESNRDGHKYRVLYCIGDHGKGDIPGATNQGIYPVNSNGKFWIKYDRGNTSNQTGPYAVMIRIVGFVSG